MACPAAAAKISFKAFIMTNLLFHPITLDETEHFYHMWNLTLERAMTYSMVTLWGWRAYNELEWAFDDNLCWIRPTKFEPNLFWAPVGDWEKADWGSLLHSGMKFICVPEKLEAIWRAQLGGRIQSEEDRGQFEYVYNTSDLASLKGNRYHKKKNHLQAYRKAYGEPDYRPMSDAIIEDCLALQDTWCQWNDCAAEETLAAENYSLNLLLTHYDRFRYLCGGALYINDEIVAFSIGEKLDDETMGVHYEKGMSSVRGVYQAINWAFVTSECSDVAYVNRAEDMDDEGLRQAKLSYHPSSFLKKYTVVIA